MRRDSEARMGRFAAVAIGRALALTGALAASGCGGSSIDTSGCTAVVSPSGNATSDHTAIQNALGNARKGSVICLAPGTFSLKAEITLSIDGVTVRSTPSGAAVLDFNGQTTGANGFTVVASDFTAQGFTIKNTAGDGLKVTQGDGITFRNVTVTWDTPASAKNGQYGLYPVQCSRVLIDGCKVSGASDAGIYVGQSNKIIVRNSEAFGNVAGIEIENSNDAEVMNNNSHDNTGGILVFSLPDLMMIGGARTRVHDNTIVHNNGTNFADKSGIVSIVPGGTGLLVMAEQNGEFDHNTITGNDSAGIALVSYVVTGKSFKSQQYDQFPESNYVHDNTVTGNGSDPVDLAFQIAIGCGKRTVTNLVWDGVVDPAKDNSKGQLTNCFKNNSANDFTNLNLDPKTGLPKCSSDAAPFNCSHDPLAPVTL